MGGYSSTKTNYKGRDPMFASPTSYMLTFSGFPLLNWGIFYKFL